jgi:hypothetical protein
LHFSFSIFRQARPVRRAPSLIARRSRFIRSLLIFPFPFFLLPFFCSGTDLCIDGAVIRVDIGADVSVPAPIVIEWVERAAIAVTNYLGRYPVKHVLITIKAGGDDAVSHGVTQGGSRVTVRLGPDATEADLKQDWIMTHEMFHLAFPTLPDRYLWMMEGLSDYLEPLARARVGQLRDRDVWREFIENFPRGLPEPGEGGLDNTQNRDRIYWGGNLYWLLADVQIRQITRNQRSVDDAIRAILKAGGNGGADWTLERVLKVADKATGTTVLKDLYDQLGTKPGTIDLAALWKQLGVSEQHHRILFDDSAPLAAIRASITAGSK